MALFVLEHFEAELMRIGLHEAVKAACYEIEISVPNFFIIFELYVSSPRGGVNR